MKTLNEVIETIKAETGIQFTQTYVDGPCEGCEADDLVLEIPNCDEFDAEDEDAKDTFYLTDGEGLEIMEVEDLDEIIEYIQENV